MNTNPRNFGIAIGRLGRDPKFFQNRDGSQKVLMSLAVRQNYKGADGKHGVDWLDLEAFIPANTSAGVYPLLKKGTKLQAIYSVATSTYVDANGDSQRKQSLRITSIELLDAPKAGAAGDVEAAAPAPIEAAYPGPIAAPQASAYAEVLPGAAEEFDV